MFANDTKIWTTIDKTGDSKKLVSGMKNLSYSERLSKLKLYSLDRWRLSVVI